MPLCCPHTQLPCHNPLRAFKRGHIFCLRAMPDPNKCNKLGTTAMHVAAETNDVVGLLLLAELGADPSFSDGEGVTPLMVASAHGNVDAVLTLLSLGADRTATNAIGETALTYAVERYAGVCDEHNVYQAAEVVRLLQWVAA